MAGSVLVVEDEREIRELLRRYLERAGLPVLTTAGGAEAIRMLSEGSAQLVLLDLGLPDVDGEEVLRAARAAAETRHLDAIRVALAAYGAADPTVGKAAGTFATPAVQTSYDRLLAQGTASQDAALRAGQTVERADIAALSNALKGLSAPRLQNIYTNLLDASRTHLAAFGNWLSR